MSEGKGGTVEYIKHHLTNLCVGDCDPVTHEAAGFWAWHADTIFFSVFLALVIVLLAWRIGRTATADAPSGMLNMAEALVEFVNKQISEVFTRHNPLIGPMALTVFTWVLLMNSMDLVPVDLLPELGKLIGVEYLKVVPTTDVNATFALSLSVFALIIFYNIKSKGFVGYLKTFLFHPFGKFLIPVNIVMTAIEEVAKLLSLALRLFGNLFAGELVFLLIALIGGTLAVGYAALLWIPLQITFDLGWLLFHLLVVTLQAFIFMVLTIVYIGMAQEENH